MRKQVGGSSGFSQVWRLWRHCCCRFGWYPLIVAPLVTASCFLDLYSSYDCEFVKVNIGFVPSNEAWNQSSVTAGLFQVSGKVRDQETLVDIILDGCHLYSNSFEEQLIHGDRTWEVTRIMAYVSGASGLVGTLTAWLMVFCPLPACFFWPGVLLPALLLGFLCEGSKFLILDTTMCQSVVWFPVGTDSLPQRAESCELGKTSYFAMGAGVCFFICLMMVCLKSPDRRKLDETYGDTEYYSHHLEDHAIETSVDEDTNNDNADFDEHVSNIQAAGDFVVVQQFSHPDYASSLGDGRSFEQTDANDLEAGNLPFESRDDASLVSRPASIASEDDTSPALNMFAEQFFTEKIARQSPPVIDDVGAPRVISEARQSTAEMMKQQTESESSDVLINQCFEDLTKAFEQQGEEENLRDVLAGKTTNDENSDESNGDIIAEYANSVNVESTVNENLGNSAHVVSAQGDCAPVDAAQVDSAEVDSAQVDSAQVDSAQVDSAQVDSTLMESIQVDSSRMDSCRVISARSDSAHIDDSAQQDSTRNDATPCETHDDTAA